MTGVETLAIELGLEKAARHLARGDGRLAVAELDALARADRQAAGRPEWWHMRILAVSSSGDNGQALEGTARALGMWPGEPEFLQLRAELLAEDGRLAEAEDLARGLLRDFPDHLRALGTYAMILSRGGEHAAAEDLLGRALAQAPDDAELLGLRFSLSAAAGAREDHLSRQLDALLAVDPENPDALHMHSLRAMAEGRVEEARHAASSAARAMPGDAEVTANARHLALLGDRSMWLIRQMQRPGWRGAWPYLTAFILGSAITFAFLGLVGGFAAVALLWAYSQYWPQILQRKRSR